MRVDRQQINKMDGFSGGISTSEAKPGKGIECGGEAGGYLLASDSQTDPGYLCLSM